MTQASTRSPRIARDAQPVVFAQDLTKLFKDFWLRDRARAVDGISFEVRPGEIFGLLGPNGSGKSTTIKMMLGLLKKTKGRLAVFGKSPNDVSVKSRIGYLPEESYLYPFLDARETLDYYGKLFGLDGAVRRKRIDELLDMVGLSAVQHRQVREYSKGMQRRIGIAQALINDPELLILDEPTTGLDPVGTRQMKDLILQLGRRGKTILLSSHLLADVEDCVDRMVILYGGKIRAEGTCDDLLETKERTIIETDDLGPDAITEIRAVLARHSRQVDRISHPRQKLEDLFIGIVERAQSEQVATSGARAGGQTASFLRGDEPSGEDLINRLISTDAPAARADAPMPTEDEARRRGERESAQLIDELLSAAPASPPPAAPMQRASGPSAAPAQTGAGASTPVPPPDDELIRNLLGEPGGPKGDGGRAP